MIARGTEAQVSVLALVGERGREVREFIEHDLGPDGLARSVVIVATSDEPANSRSPANAGLLGGGRYWARTSDLRLVEAALSQLS